MLFSSEKWFLIEQIKVYETPKREYLDGFFDPQDKPASKAEYTEDEIFFTNPLKPSRMQNRWIFSCVTKGACPERFASLLAAASNGISSSFISLC